MQAREQCLILQDMQIYLDCEGSNPVAGGCVRRIHTFLRYPENFRVARPGAELDDDVQGLALVCRHRLTRRMNHGSPCNENKRKKRLTFVEPARLTLLPRGRKSALYHVGAVGAFCALLIALYLINGVNYHPNGPLTRRTLRFYFDRIFW